MAGKKFLLLLLPLLVAHSFNVLAQSQPILDQNPAGLRWFQINTPKFQVIFPQGFESEAQRTANTLQAIYTPVSRTLGREPRKISIILQNQTANSNGFVTITPRRSEFFTLPPQDYSLLGNNDWINLLAIHEFRHVVQYDKALTGVSKAMYYVFGANGLALTTGISVPSWFWEGDAVGTETALTLGGRGRIPQFDLAYRAQLLTRGPYAYPKAYLRSFRDFVPNHYVLGYFMTSYARRNYGADSWSNILSRTYRFPFIPFAFSRAIKKETGLTVEQLYRKSAEDISGLWQEQVNGLPLTPAESVPTAPNRVFTNYQFPQYLSDGRILALKFGLGDVDQFVALDGEGNEERIFVPGFVNAAGMLSVVNDRIVWSERGFDPRWGMRDYAIVKVYDLRTRKLRQLTRRSRLTGPALSPDGQRIVAVHVSTENDVNLHVLDGQTGDLIRVIPNPGNSFYLNPRWSPDGTQVVAVKLNRQGKTIEVIDVATGEAQERIPYTSLNIAHPVWHGEYIYYNSPYNGIDNIYAVHTETGEQFQVTSRRFGSYNPAISPDGQWLAYNDFTPDGQQVVVMPNDPARWVPLDQVEDRTVAYYAPLVEQEGTGNILDQIPEQQYPVGRFSRLGNLLNPYSWSPLLDPSGQALTLSLSSQNLLSTALADVGYGFDANERTSSFFGRFSYQGFFPVLDAEFETRGRNANVLVRTQQGTTVTVPDSWQEHIGRFGVRLPFILTHSKYIETLNFSADASIRRISGRFAESLNGNLQAVRYSASYRRLHKRNIRDVNPPWGQTISVFYRHTPFGGDFDAEMFAAQSNLFFPGLLKHHSLLLRGGYQREMTGAVYPFTTPLFFPRGFVYTRFNQFYNGAVEYRLPLFSPDWILGRWLYFQRFKGGLFYDFGRGHLPEGRIRDYQSAGVDLTTEFNFMRLPILLELGARTIYRFDTGEIIVQPLIVNVGF